MNYWDRLVIICALMGAGLAAHGDYVGMGAAVILASLLSLAPED